MKNFASTFPLMVTILLAFSACTKDEVQEGPPSRFGFESNEPYIFTEADPDFYIPVVQDHTQFGYTAADLSIEHKTSSTEVYSDYYIDKRIMIYGGDVKDYIGTKLYNDGEADGNDTLDVTLVNLDGNAYLDEESLQTARVIILDDDNVPDTEMRIHAFWTGEEEISRDFRKDFDLDLYVMTNVEEGPDGIESGDYFMVSEKANSFEDITIPATAPDQEYYILIAYMGNNFNDAAAAVKGYFKLSGFGNNDTKSNVWEVEFDEPGYYYYFGPFKKTGKTFARVQ
jgi:hypothetical protein